MTDYTHDIERYITGKMTPAERHALERKALSDPFLADALEGAQEHANTFRNDVDSLLAQLNNRKKSAWIWSLRVAAAITVVAVASIWIWNNTTQPENQNLALHSDETPAPLSQSGPINTDTLTVGSPEDNVSTAPTAREKKSEPGLGTIAATSAGTSQPTEEQTGGEVTAYFEAPISDTIVVATEAELLADVPLEIAAPAREMPVAADLDQEISKPVSRSAAKAQPAVTSVQGRVTSAEDGSPLPGVNVVVKGTTLGTVTDVNGNYILNEVDLQQSTLVYSFIGLQTQEVVVGNRSAIDASLSIDASQLSEVVVTGYGYSGGKDDSTPTVSLAHPEIGQRAYQNYLEKNVRYPQQAIANKIEGRVTIEFLVKADGSVGDFVVIRGIGSGCDEELIRLITEGPRWIATKRDNVPVEDRVRVRLKFELPE